MISDYAIAVLLLGSVLTAPHPGVLIAALGINQILCQIVKRIVKRERPNKVNLESFYSGHTSSAFVCVAFMPCVLTIAMAVFVGYRRVAEKWHWPSDVLVGAVVGYLMGRIING